MFLDLFMHLFNELVKRYIYIHIRFNIYTCLYYYNIECIAATLWLLCPDPAASPFSLAEPSCQRCLHSLQCLCCLRCLGCWIAALVRLSHWPSWLADCSISNSNSGWLLWPCLAGWFHSPMKTLPYMHGHTCICMILSDYVWLNRFRTLILKYPVVLGGFSECLLFGGAESRRHKPDTETLIRDRERPEFVNCHTGRSRAPPGRLGDTWKETCEDRQLDAGHHPPHWETNEGRQVELRRQNELERKCRTPLKKELRTATVNCLGKKRLTKQECLIMNVPQESGRAQRVSDKSA